MGDAQRPREPARNLIVSSTPSTGYQAQSQEVAPDQLPSAASSGPCMVPFPTAGNGGIAATPLARQPRQQHRMNQQPFPPAPFMQQRSHSAGYQQPSHGMYSTANAPRSFPAWVQQQQPQQMLQYQGGAVSPSSGGPYMQFPEYPRTFVGPYGQHFPQLFGPADAPVQPPGSYQAPYPPHCPPQYSSQISPYYYAPPPPRFIPHQMPNQHMQQQQLLLPPPSQPLPERPSSCARRHSYPIRQYLPYRRGSESDPSSSQFVRYPGVPSWDGRMWGGVMDMGAYPHTSIGPSGQNYYPHPPLSPPCLELLQSNSSSGTSGVSTSATTPGTAESSSPLPVQPAAARGPPRKPKQSGHALWVGNLPPVTRVQDLKELFSGGATNDIESVFLISKTCCAFVNYRTERACLDAMARFHDSWFQNIRLVCRLRRNSNPGIPATGGFGSVTPPSGPAADCSAVRESGEEDDGEDEEAVAEDEPKPGGEMSSSLPPCGVVAHPRGKDRIFIVKSLTVEDLDSSVRSGIWATQSHNEVVLNEAFETAENVYLIFSANKSGEYYGYARMMSAILDDLADVGEWTPPVYPMEDPDAPKEIYTPATETAPRGRVIDDSARGTIFWEALSDDEDLIHADSYPGTQQGTPTATTPWGKPFKIEWISTNRVPFYRTKGLRNLLNGGREVKIARDGTEIEEKVGKRMLNIFHRSRSGGPPPPNIAGFGSGRRKREEDSQ